MCTSTSVISTPSNRCCTLAFRLHRHHTSSSIFVILKFQRIHLKFSVYGRKQTDRHTYIHTHMHNAVTLVWGSLRLAQIMDIISMASFLMTHLLEPASLFQGSLVMRPLLSCWVAQPSLTKPDSQSHKKQVRV